MTTPAPELSSPVALAAKRLMESAATGVPCAPVRDLIGESDLDLAYAVQQDIIKQRQSGGARVVGRKIGLTSPAVQRQLGVEQPDFGVLFEDMDVTGQPVVDGDPLLQPKAEAEIAFVLSADLDRPGLDLESVAAAVDYATAAIEIVDSRIRNWDITITDTIADNGSSGLFVLGHEHVSLEDFLPIQATMRLFVNDDLVSEGTGADCLGDPLQALLWLARTAYEHGEPLRAGDVILSGALGPMVPITPGSTVRAEISPLGSVAATFSNKDTP